MRYLMIGDWETYFNRKEGYSLGTMTTEAYIRDKRFEAQCFCAHVKSLRTNMTRTLRIPKEKLDIFMRDAPWDETIFVAHNAMFDAAILSLRYNAHPRRILDTQGMAQYLYRATCRKSLAALTEYHNIGRKGTTAVDYEGRHWEDLSEYEQQNLMDYCLQDVKLTVKLFHIMRKYFPNEQLAYMDLLLKCFTRPLMLGDVARLDKYIQDLQRQRKELFDSLSLRPDVMEYRDAAIKDMKKKEEIINEESLKQKTISKYLNAAKGENLARELRAVGAKIPFKINKNGQAIYAFAKTDEGMQQLLDSDDPKIAALAEAKISIASSGPISKAILYRDMAKRGAMCVPLKYYGAHTSRLTSTDKLNFLAMQRGSEIRKALIAPEGYRIVAGDSSQIQARLTMWYAGCAYFLDLFRRNDVGELDVYCTFGSEYIYSREINKKDKAERQVSKRAVLGLGFRMGWLRFMESCLEDGRTMGIAVPTDEAIYKRAWKAFRMAAHELEGVWSDFETLAGYMIVGVEQLDNYRGIIRSKKDALLMPNNMELKYTNIQRRETDNNFTFQSDIGKWSKTHGGPILNNVIQALEQCHMQAWALRVQAAGFPILLLPHDELVCLAKEDEADDCVEFVRNTMRTALPWAEGLPLNAEVGHSHSYGMIKKV